MIMLSSRVPNGNMCFCMQFFKNSSSTLNWNFVLCQKMCSGPWKVNDHVKSEYQVGGRLLTFSESSLYFCSWSVWFRLDKFYKGNNLPFPTDNRNFFGFVLKHLLFGSAALNTCPIKFLKGNANIRGTVLCLLGSGVEVFHSPNSSYLWGY